MNVQAIRLSLRQENKSSSLTDAGSGKHIIKGSQLPPKPFLRVRTPRYSGVIKAPGSGYLGCGIAILSRCPSLHRLYVKITNLESSRITAWLMLRLISNGRGPIFGQLEVPDTSGSSVGSSLGVLPSRASPRSVRVFFLDLLGFVHFSYSGQVRINSSVLFPMPESYARRASTWSSRDSVRARVGMRLHVRQLP